MKLPGYFVSCPGMIDILDNNVLILGFENLNLPGNQATPWARVVNQSQSSTKGYAQQTQRLLTAKEVGLVTFCLHSMTRLTQHIRKTQPAQCQIKKNCCSFFILFYSYTISVPLT